MIRNIISKGPKYQFPSNIYFNKCREEIAAALNEFGNRWYKREYVEHKALKQWKLSILKLVNKRISFYSQNTNLLPPNRKTSLHHLKQGIQEFHKKYVLAPADKAANNVVVVWRLHYVNILQQELGGTKAYELQLLAVVNDHICYSATKFAVCITEGQDRFPTLYWLPKLHKKNLQSTVYCKFKLLYHHWTF